MRASIIEHLIHEGTLDYAISQIEVEAIAQTQTADKSADPDNIHPSMVQTSGFWMRQALMLLFNKVLNKWTRPWKSGDVKFIKKIGKVDYKTPSSYKPITLSSYVGKTMERILIKRFTDFLAIRGQVDEKQGGFGKQRLTSKRYIARVIANIQNAVRSQRKAAAIFLDYSEAFDLFGKKVFHGNR